MEFLRLGFQKYQFHSVLKIISRRTGCYLVQTVVGGKLCLVIEVLRTKISATSKSLLSIKTRQIYRKCNGDDQQAELLLQNPSVLA